MNGKANGHDQQLDARAQSVGQFALQGLAVELLEVLRRGVDEGETAPAVEIATELTRKLNAGVSITPSDLDLLRPALQVAESLPVHDAIPAVFEREFLVPGAWLPADRAGMLAGRGGVGKSRLALQLVYALSTGRPFLGEAGGIEYSEAAGLEPESCGTVYASWEDEVAEIGSRLAAFCTDSEMEKPIGGMAIVPMTDAVWEQPPGAHVGSLSSAGRKLQTLCEVRKARLLVVDPVASAYGGDDNRGPSVRAFVSSWDAWAQAARCAVLFIIHPPKLRGGSGEDNSDNAYAGSHQFQAAARFVWRLERVPEPDDKRKRRQGADDTKRFAYELRCDKASYGMSPSSVALQLAAKTNRSGVYWRAVDGMEYEDDETLRRRLQDKRRGEYDGAF